eukprot:TRINITY_DN32522_c0_g1_i1.p1 TRINITY_DN32522_c0_g1~~TRINITY_DN32522_c0_g1_i1.p1  ORF type:complete len:215 (-),score=73.45 TRINITY_DN32522_c0_g1_i1:107-751(-)
MSGDTSALEKQLNVKTKAIVELQATLDEKSRYLFDQSDTLENKDRGTYYLERTIEARNRELAILRKETEELEAAADKSGFGPKIDEGEANVAAAEAAEEDLQAQIQASEREAASAKLQTEKYAALMKRFDNGLLSRGKMLDELQKIHKAVQTDNTNNAAMCEELKGDMQAVAEEADKLRGHHKFLDQYRVDAIFRVFTLKAKIKILDGKVNAME